MPEPKTLTPEAYWKFTTGLLRIQSQRAELETRLRQAEEACFRDAGLESSVVYALDDATFTATPKDAPKDTPKDAPKDPA